MVRIEKLTVTVTVTVEGDAESGERAFARLFDRYSRIRDERVNQRTDQAAAMERDRSLSPNGGRQ